MVKGPPANAVDTGSISGLGRFHMPRSNSSLTNPNYRIPESCAAVLLPSLGGSDAADHLATTKIMSMDQASKHIFRRAEAGPTQQSLHWTNNYLRQHYPMKCNAIHISLVQSLSRVQLFATPWITARQASLSITNSRSPLKHMSIESVMTSSHIILSHPLLLP